LQVLSILDRKNSDDENFYILGYFALALKILTVFHKKLDYMGMRGRSTLFGIYLAGACNHIMELF